MFALLPVFKPRGVNSRRVVDAIETAVGSKVGHAGTLDPLASGVLLTVIGPATRLVPYIQAMPKRYTARYQLGIESDSDDLERTCRSVPIDAVPSHEAVCAATRQLVGSIAQKPPIFSAIKVNGRRAYRMAHRGRPVEIQSRRITVHSMQLLSYEFPFFEIDVCCSSGTYLRSLGRDIAAQLNTKCVMLDLCRTAIGPFDIGRCASLLDVTEGRFADRLVNPLEAFSGLPIVALDEVELEPVTRGIKYDCPQKVAASEMLLTDLGGRLHAVLRPASDGRWRPALNFSKYWRGEKSNLTPSSSIRQTASAG